MQLLSCELVILDLSLPDGPSLDRLPLPRTVSTMPTVFSAQDVGSEVCTAGIQATLVKAPTSNQDFLNTIRALVGDKKQAHPSGPTEGEPLSLGG